MAARRTTVGDVDCHMVVVLCCAQVMFQHDAHDHGHMHDDGRVSIMQLVTQTAAACHAACATCMDKDYSCLFFCFLLWATNFDTVVEKAFVSLSSQLSALFFDAFSPFSHIHLMSIPWY